MPAAPPAGALSVSPATVDFGTQPVGAKAKPQTITLRNPGPGPVTLQRVALSGDRSDFTVDDPCSGSTLAAGQTCSLTVSFTPTVGESRTASLTLTPGAPGSPQSLTLRGTGSHGPAAAAKIVLLKTSLRLGETTQLCWSLMNARSAHIDPEVGTIDDPRKPGCHPISPKQTTTYVLTAIGVDDQTVRSDPVTVQVIPHPEIAYFRAEKRSIKLGEATQLCWSLTEVKSARIDPGIGAIDDPGKPDCRTISPKESTNYILTAAGIDGQQLTRLLTVWVHP